MMEGMLPLGEELKVVRLLEKMCDKKNSVLFTDTECFILSLNFKLADESQVLLKVPRKNNMYSFDMKTIVPQKDLTCLHAKDTKDKSMLWHRRLGHINFKITNKLVKENLVRGLPSKRLENDQTCVSCLKGKQHKVSFKSKFQNSISQSLFMLHMDLFGPTSMSSIMHKKYCLIITDDFCRFTWVFFLATKDETSRILKSFITKIENLVEKKVKIIRCDNRIEFKNRVTNSVKKKAEAVNTACYVQNRVLVVTPHFKTLYELFKDRSPAVSFMRPFGCHVTILNTLDQLGKFDGKLDEGIFVGYSITSKAFRVYNTRIRKVEENLHITFLENKSIIACGGLEWLFNIDALLKSMNYALVLAVNTATPIYADYHSDPLMPDLEDTRIFDDAYDDRNEGAEADYNNLEIVISVSPIPFTRIHKDHPKEQIIREVNSTVHTRKMAKQNEAGLITFINKQRRTNHNDFQNYLFTFFLSQMEPKKTLVDLPLGKKAIRTKLVYRNKREQRGIVVRNKARLVTQGYRQEEDIDYDEVFALVARIKVIRLFLAYVPFMDFIVYQMDVNSAFLYGTIEEEVYVSQPPDFVDPEFSGRVYKVEKALYGLHQAPRAWYQTLSTYLLDNEFKRGKIDKTLFIKQIKNDILLVQVYVDDIIFGSTKRPDIMFAVCTCLRFQVQLKVFHMHAVKRIFRYLKGQPTLGLWYPKDSSLELIAYSDSNYAGASLDRKSTTRGCQFLGSRLISWQCKKQTIVANSTNEAKYIAASNCYGQVLWLQNQLLDYGYNFMMTKIHVDIESAICMVKNHVYHSKTKHIEIRHHFIRDFYEKRLIEMVKIHADYNVADLLTKAFDVTSSKTINSVKQIHAIVDGKAVVISESSVRSDRLFDNEDGITCLTNDDIFENLALMGYEPLSTKLTFQKGGYTPRSDEGRLKLEELIDLCTTLSNRVSTLENELYSTKVVYHKAFITLTKRVKKLETQLKQKRSRAVTHSSDEKEPTVHIEDSPKQWRMIKELDKDKDVNLNRPFSKAEVRKNMVMYWKDQGGYKQSYFKGMKYKDIRPIFERVWDQVHTFLLKDSEIKKEVMKRSRFHLQQESSKKQKLDQQTKEKKKEVEAQADRDQEVKEMKLYMRIVLDEDIAKPSDC
nr:hypothetical protein [Tanacetum cinerariifolium]